ncbi:MAG: CoA ester lyase [Pseudomonadota bacterium]
MTAIRPRRSALYMPGANARALEKAKGLSADVLILDLEDAVAPDKKDEARGLIRAALAEGGYDGREIVIRTNGVPTSEFKSDLELVAASKPDAVLVPKVESGADVTTIRSALMEANAALPIWAMIETPLGILNVAEIAAAAAHETHPLACFVIGTNDLVKDTRAQLSADRAEAMFWLQSTVTAARAFGIDVLDGVFNAFKDLDGYRRECDQGLRLGMDGKTLIHPTQIEYANTVFAPSDSDVASARQILEAFDQPENAGKGVITLDGKMVELLHAEMAQRTVALADAIARRGN